LTNPLPKITKCSDQLKTLTDEAAAPCMCLAMDELQVLPLISTDRVYLYG